MAETIEKDPLAPHGYAEDGVTPLAPYGLKTDGTPKLSNRGRAPKAGGAAKASAASATKGRSAGAAKAREQREGLVALADMLLSPAMSAVSHPAVIERMGHKKAAGLAGSLVIVDGYVPAYADWLVQVSQTKPGMLAWMDTMEDNAIYLQGAIITAQLVKAVASNIMAPNMRLADAAKLKAKMRAAQMAAAIEEEARRMGVSLVDEPDRVREHPNPADMTDAPHPAGMPV